MKDSADIPVHRLLHTDFYASATDAGNLGDFASSHRLDFFAIVWFRSSSTDHYIDFVPYPVKKDLIYLLSPNQVHALPGKPPPEANIIIFSKAFFESIEADELRLLFLPFNNEGIFIPDTTPSDLLFEMILLEKTDLHLLRLYVTAFLTHLHRLSGAATYHDERLRLLFSLVSSHYKTHKLADFYAGQIGLTAKRLNQIVKDKLGLSVSQLIYTYILIEAKREVSHSTKSIKEIAIELGFNGQSYFTRFFKKQTGSTPEQFRHSSRLC